MKNKVIVVFCHGRIARTKEGFCAFEYDHEWLTGGFSIPPRSLPLEKRHYGGLSRYHARPVVIIDPGID